MIRFHCIPFAVFFPGAVPDPRPLAFSNHRGLSGTPLPNLSDFPSPYLFALWKVLYLAFHFLFFFFLVVIIIFLLSNDHLASYTCIFPLSQHLCWLISVSPGPFPSFPCPASPELPCWFSQWEASGQVWRMSWEQSQDIFYLLSFASQPHL